MTPPRITPVILCGGSGTRLWPLSRKSLPKQFVPLIGDKSLLRLTVERLAAILPAMVCVAAEEHRFLVAQTLHEVGLNGTVILEPSARNTAAAMALAALAAQGKRFGAGEAACIAQKARVRSESELGII